MENTALPGFLNVHHPSDTLPSTASMHAERGPLSPLLRPGPSTTANRSSYSTHPPALPWQTSNRASQVYTWKVRVWPRRKTIGSVQCFMKLGDTSKLFTDLTQRRDLDFHIRRALPGPQLGRSASTFSIGLSGPNGLWHAAFTLVSRHKRTLPATCTKDYRSPAGRVRTSSVVGFIQGLKFVGLKAQVKPQ